ASICPGTALTLPKYFCRNCENPLALGEDLISKKFVGASGPAFMFSYAMNVVVGPKIGRKLLTGSYVVADVMCSKCGEKLGWKYLQYYDPFILASQADQVCYIKYPRVRNRDDPWVTVTRLNPRGRVQGSSALEDPLQPSTSGNLSAAEDLAGVGLV
uniref:Protein yippee-like n=1 Tax=Brassica oleracea var. oleracea TaxID=109376 RepID=A0A0D3DN67_BRAOL